MLTKREQDVRERYRFSQFRNANGHPEMHRFRDLIDEAAHSDFDGVHLAMLV